MNLSIGVFIPEGMKIPRFYEVAYRCWDRSGSMCYPIPINWIVRFCVWFKLLNRPGFGRTDKVGLKAYQRGLRQGRREGYMKAVKSIYHTTHGVHP